MIFCISVIIYLFSFYLCSLSFILGMFVYFLIMTIWTILRWGRETVNKVIIGVKVKTFRGSGLEKLLICWLKTYQSYENDCGDYIRSYNLEETKGVNWSLCMMQDKMDSGWDNLIEPQIYSCFFFFLSVCKVGRNDVNEARTPSSPSGLVG